MLDVRSVFEAEEVLKARILWVAMFGAFPSKARAATANEALCKQSYR